MYKKIQQCSWKYFSDVLCFSVTLIISKFLHRGVSVVLYITLCFFHRKAFMWKLTIMAGYAMCILWYLEALWVRLIFFPKVSFTKSIAIYCKWIPQYYLCIFFFLGGGEWNVDFMFTDVTVFLQIISLRGWECIVQAILLKPEFS